MHSKMESLRTMRPDTRKYQSRTIETPEYAISEPMNNSETRKNVERSTSYQKVLRQPEFVANDVEQDQAQRMNQTLSRQKGDSSIEGINLGSMESFNTLNNARDEIERMTSTFSHTRNGSRNVDNCESKKLELSSGVFGTYGHNIITAVRVRPFFVSERRAGCRCIIEMSRGTGETNSAHDASIRILNPIVLPSRFHSQENTRSNINMVGLTNSRRNEVTGSKDCSMNFMHKFHFDHHFWSFNHEQEQEYASQELIYDTIGSYMVNLAFEGFNCSVFAYGQTSAGKTYTMMGDDRPVKMTDSASLSSASGLVPRVCFGMFEYAQAHTEFKFSTFHVSYVEIYQEHVYDLLAFEENTKHALKIREHPDAGVFVQNARKVLVSNYVDINFLIFEGIRRRSVAPTKSNARSSRSHTILSIYISQSELSEGAEMSDKYLHKLSKITLVDLAGSERVENLGASGAQLRESVAINRSLSTLADVIHVLSKDAKQNQHIPYRNSVLTRLLKESFGGNTRTIMLAAISPCCVHYEETLGTLKYVDRARRVTNFPHVNTSSNGTHQGLREEVLELRAKLQAVNRHHNPSTQILAGDKSLQDRSNMRLEASVAMGGAELSAASSPKNSDLTIMHEMDTQFEQKSTQTSEQKRDFSREINRKLCIGAIKLLQAQSRIRYLEMYRAFKVLKGSGNQSHELPKFEKRRVVTRFRLPSASPEEDEEFSLNLEPSEVASVYETLESLSSYSERKNSGGALINDEWNREGSLELLEEIATCCCSAISSKHRSICKVKLQQWQQNECGFTSPEDKPSSSLATRSKGKEGFTPGNNAEANFFLQKASKSDFRPDHFQIVHAFRASTDDFTSVLTPPARYQMNGKKYMEERRLTEEEVNPSRFETNKSTKESSQPTRVSDKTENCEDCMTKAHLPALEKLYNGLLLLVKKSEANQAVKGLDTPEIIVSEDIAVENQENDASKRPEADEQPDTDVRFTDSDSAVKAISSLMEGYISRITDMRTELSEALANARDLENKLAKMRKEQKEALKKMNDENNVVLTRMRTNQIHASIKTHKTEQDLRYAQSQLLKREEALQALEKELNEANDRLAECGSVLEISKDMRTLSVTRLREEVAHKLTKVTEREEIANLEEQLAGYKTLRESYMDIISQIEGKIWSQPAQELLAKNRLTRTNSEICSAAVAQSSDPLIDENSSKYADNDPMIGRLDSILSSLSLHEKARNLAVTRLEDEPNSSLVQVGSRDEQIGLLRNKLVESQKICETTKNAKAAEIEELKKELARNALIITELDNERFSIKERAIESQNALEISHEDYLSAIIRLKNELYISSTKNAKNEEDLNRTIDHLSGSVECLVAQRDIHSDTIARLERELSVISSVAIKTKEELNFLNNQLEKSEALNTNFREINAKLEEELYLVLKNSNTIKDDLLQAQTLLKRAETSHEETTRIQSKKSDQLEKEISLTTDKLRRAEEDLHLADNQLSQKEESFNSISLTLTSTINGLEDDLSTSLLRTVQLEREIEQRSSRRIELSSTPLTSKNLPMAAYLRFQQSFDNDAFQKRRSGMFVGKEDCLITFVESDATKSKRLEEELLSSKNSQKRKEEDCRHVQNQLAESMVAHRELCNTHLGEVTRLKEELDFSSSQLTSTRRQLAHSESIHKTSVEIHRGSITQVHKKMALLSSEMDKIRNELALRQSQLSDSQALSERYRMRMEKIEKDLAVNLKKAAQREMELTQITYQFSQRSMATTSNESQGLDGARLQHESSESLSNTKTLVDELQEVQSQLTESTSAFGALTQSYSTDVTSLKDEPPNMHHQTILSSDRTDIATKIERERTQLRLADYESTIIALTESHVAVARQLEEDAFSCRKEIKKLSEELRGANTRITDFWPSFEALMNTHAISTARLRNEISLFHISTAKNDAELSSIIEEIKQLCFSFAGLQDFFATMSQPYNTLPAQHWASEMEGENGCLVYQHKRVNSSSVSAKHKQILAIAELKFVKPGGARAPQREDEMIGAVPDLIILGEAREKTHKSGRSDKKTYCMEARCKDKTPDESAHIYFESTTLSNALQQNLLESDPTFTRVFIAQSQSQNPVNALEVDLTHNFIAVCKERLEATYQQITHLEREFESFRCEHDTHIEKSTMQLKKHRDYFASISGNLPSLTRNLGQRIQTHLSAEKSLLLHQECLSAQVARLEKKLVTSTNALIQAEKNFYDLQQSSGDKITQLEKEVLNVSAQLGTLQRDVTQQDACLAVASGNLKAFENRIHNYEADVERGKEREEFLSASIAAISTVSVAQIGELERKVSILESKCKHLKKKLILSKKNEALLIAHTEKLTSQKSDLNQKVNLIEDQKDQVKEALCSESKRAIQLETSMQKLQSHVDSLEKLFEQRTLQSRECQLMQESELTSCHVLRLEHIHHVYQEEIGRQILAATEWEQKLILQTSILWQVEEDFRAYVKSNTQKNEHLRTVSQEQASKIERLKLELDRHLMYIEDISVYFHFSDFGPRGFRIISPRKEVTSKRITSHYLQNLDDWFEQNISINEDKPSKGEAEEDITFPSSFHRESIVSSAEMRDAWTEMEGDIASIKQAQTEITQLKSTVQYLKETLDLREDMIAFLDARIVQFEFQTSSIGKSNDQAPAQQCM